MQLCGFWLASEKKCQMTLGDSSLIWIQVISFESEVKVPQLCPTLGDCMGYTESMEFSRPEYWSG